MSAGWVVVLVVGCSVASYFIGVLMAIAAHEDAQKPEMSPESFAALDRDASRAVGTLSRN